VEFLRRFQFSSDDLEYLATIPGRDGRPIFDAGYLSYLQELTLSLDIDAIPEGTIVFPERAAAASSWDQSCNASFWNRSCSILSTFSH
jgi:nicotinic acid phosphoribosyltransferase